MKQKMHFASKMFISNPYVVRVEYMKGTGADMDITEFRKILKKERSLMQATWGYTDPVWEKVSVNEESNPVVVGANFTWYVPELYLRSYWVFSDDMDALHFRLSVGETAKQMHIWPKNYKFTMIEFIDEL